MEIRDVEVVEEKNRVLPVPVELTTTIEFKVPKLRPVYTATNVPVYVPRFVEVAVPAEFCEEAFLGKHFSESVGQFPRIYRLGRSMLHGCEQGHGADRHRKSYSHRT